MASSLKSKLNRLKSADKPKAEPPKPMLLEYSFTASAHSDLFSLSAYGLKCIGCEGEFHPHRTLFLDTETTGLSGGAGTVAFLVGLGRITDGNMLVRQYLMPSYAAESELLSKVAAFADGCDTIVTFNGKSFDLPLLASRCVMTRMNDPFERMRHIDLIHPARRVWKLRLKDCSLSNIEEKVLGAPRGHDISGSDVPQRYFDFLKTGDIRLLEDIIAHNRQDILSLGTLLVRLCRAYQSPAEQTSMLDVFSIGKSLEKQGEREEAARCYEQAARPMPMTDISRLREAKYAPMAKEKLSMMLKRDGKIDEAEQMWLELAQKKSLLACTELAKVYEHRDKDFEKALLYTRRALDLTENENERTALLLRCERLQRKLTRSKR